jgi:hypothetical protein
VRRPAVNGDRGDKWSSAVIARAGGVLVIEMTVLTFLAGLEEKGGRRVRSPKQKSAARRNIKKAAAAAKNKKTIRHLPKATRTALGKQANKVKRQRHSR